MAASQEAWFQQLVRSGRRHARDNGRDWERGVATKESYWVCAVWRMKSKPPSTDMPNWPAARRIEAEVSRRCMPWMGHHIDGARPCRCQWGEVCM
jgi:hypothetical protein